jgi:hypothetical protein
LFFVGLQCIGNWWCDLFHDDYKKVVCLVFLDGFWQWWCLVEVVVGGTYEWEHAIYNEPLSQS